MTTNNPAEALRRLYRAYVGTLETGRNRILDLGGTCDSVDVMENGDPALREAREAIAALTSPAPAGGEVLTDAVVIWSEEHRAYWRPGAAGYTHHIEKAGRYTLADAKSHTSHCGPEKGIRIRPAPLSVTPPPSPDVAGVVEMLREGAQSIDNDGTPAQVGPSSDQLCEAATLLESLSAEKGRLAEALAALLHFLKDHKAHFYAAGWTERERNELMEVMHNGNLLTMGTGHRK